MELIAAEWLAEGKTLTPLEALRLFGAFRLSSIIYDLRRCGAQIETEIIRRKDGTAFARYKVDKNNLYTVTEAMRQLQQPHLEVRKWV